MNNNIALEQIEIMKKNVESLFEANGGYVKFDLTKSLIEYVFSNSALLKRVGTQVGNGSDAGIALFYRKGASAEGSQAVSFDLVKREVKFDENENNFDISTETVDNLANEFGLDMENELINVMKYEAKASVERAVHSRMVKCAIDAGNVDSLRIDVPREELTAAVDVFANHIASKTRRGAANFCVASKAICEILLDRKNDLSMITGSFTEVGQVVERMPLICDPYCGSDYALIGYCGDMPTDSGIVFCPNNMFMLSKAYDESAGTPILRCESNYGICADGESGGYYHLIKFG